MKILDRYILVSFLKTFFAVLIILTLIFLLQSIWQIISELAGKDLDLVVVGKLLFYITPSLLPMVLPLTILVSSIMTFGSFAEKSEFAAMKASGISLQRIMRSLTFFILALSFATFYAASHAVPWSKFKSKNLRYNIQEVKPALAIAEGEFNQIDRFNIKVAKKTGKNGQDLHDVTIHLNEKGSSEMTIVKAEKGKLIGSEDSGILTLILYNGISYQTPKTKTYRERRRRPFIKNEFKENRFNIDVSGHNDVDLDKDRFSNVASMLNVSELKKALDSLSDKFNTDKENYANTLFSRNGINQIIRDGEPYRPGRASDAAFRNRKIDSVEFNIRTQEISAYPGDTLRQVEKDILRTIANFVWKEPTESDSVFNLPLQDKTLYTASYDSIYKQLRTSQEKRLLDKFVTKSEKNSKQAADSTSSRTQQNRTLTDLFAGYDIDQKVQIANLALSTSRGTQRTIQERNKIIESRIEQLNVTEIEIHDKYALAVMCFVLFFVGAPLGALIRKGGIGLPMVIAIGLFLGYYYIGMFAKNGAKGGTISPFIATWLSTFIMLPLSVFVTYRATTDRGFPIGEVIKRIFDFLAPIFRPLVRLIKPFLKSRKRRGKRRK